MSKQENNPETVLLPESDLIPLALVAVESWRIRRQGGAPIRDYWGFRLFWDQASWLVRPAIARP